MGYRNRRSGTKLDLLNKIRESNTISKAMLAKELGLSKPAVTENISQLLDSGIIVETGEGEASRAGGRKPVMLELNKMHRYIAAIDLSFLSPVCVLGNLGCEFLQEEVLLVPDDAAPEERREQVKRSIDLMLDRQGADRSDLGCIVIATPGVVGADDEIHLVNEQHSRWTDIRLKEYLREEYGIHVSLKNDVNMALLSEMELGKGRQQQNMAYISCGHGIGAGIALDRKIYEGEHSAAGEIGFFIDAAGSGRTLEQTISIRAILAKVGEDLENGAETVLRKEERIGFGQLADAYDKGDSYVRELFYENGKELGAAVVNIVLLLDIGMVIFGGVYSHFSETFIKGIEDVMRTIPVIDPKLEVSEFGSRGSLYGSLVRGMEYVMKVYSKE